MSTVRPLVTIDVPQAQLVVLRPKMEAGDLPLAKVEKYAPKLAHQLLDTFDFSDSIGKGRPASLSVAKAYSRVSTAQYRQLAKIDTYRNSENNWSTGIASTLGIAVLGVGAAFLGMAGGHEFALGLVSGLTGIGTLFVGAAAADGLTDDENKLTDELAKIASEPLLLPAPEVNQPG